MMRLLLLGRGKHLGRPGLSFNKWEFQWLGTIMIGVKSQAYMAKWLAGENVSPLRLLKRQECARLHKQKDVASCRKPYTAWKKCHFQLRVCERTGTNRRMCNGKLRLYDFVDFKSHRYHTGSMPIPGKRAFAIRQSRRIQIYWSTDSRRRSWLQHNNR